MKEYTVRALYTISVEMTIEAESREEAMEIAECNTDDCIKTEWNGNSVFAYPCGDIIEMTLEADGAIRDFTCDDEEEN